MGSMFEYCKALTSVGDLSGWNTSNVTDMGSMFYACKALTSLDVSHFDTSKVTYMGNMFSACKALTSLDLSGWNTSNVTSMYDMFSACNKLQTVTLGKDFKFVGTDGYLPTPSSSYITDANGKWYAPDGTAYTPEELAQVTRTTAIIYYAVSPHSGGSAN